MYIAWLCGSSETSYFKSEQKIATPNYFNSCWCMQDICGVLLFVLLFLFLFWYVCEWHIYNKTIQSLSINTLSFRVISTATRDPTWTSKEIRCQRDPTWASKEILCQPWLQISTEPTMEPTIETTGKTTARMVALGLGFQNENIVLLLYVPLFDFIDWMFLP